VLAAWTVQGLGGALGLSVLFVQLAFYLGWSGLAEDLYLTFVARNRGVRGQVKVPNSGQEKSPPLD
jgi:hypothetical protein